MKIEFDYNNPEMVIDEVYNLIKCSWQSGFFKQIHLNAFAELFTELAERAKVEESEE